MGNFDDFERPESINMDTPHLNSEEDPAITLTDIYQFLLFEGELVKNDPIFLGTNTNFKKLKEILQKKLSAIQKVTVEQVLKRIIKKTDFVEAEIQTDEDPLIKELELVQAKELDLYKKKYDLEEENK